MDGTTTYIGEDGAEEERPPLNSKRLSFASQTSAHTLHAEDRSARQMSPLVERRRMRTFSNATSDGEIHSPVPLRHHVLQASESRHWLAFPPMLSPSSRPISPLSNATTPPRRRPAHQRSLGSLKEEEHTPVSPTLASLRHSEKKHGRDNSMARRWVRWMHKEGIKSWTVPCGIALSAWVRWATGLGPYSGQSTSPMFGDYEAQRHWMELTIHLPLRQWYTYDLQYWGLDYPPLTAYISWLCGIIGSWINPAWLALDESRGYESPESKVFMRASVLVLDLLVYIPALVLFARTWLGTRSSRTQDFAVLQLLLQPALILIDSGHFQYNSVMLGFALLALDFFAAGHDLAGAVCFVLSLGFKQMALYYAPAIGSYLLGKCVYIGPIEGSKLFLRLAAVTVLTFAVLFLPWLPPFAPLSGILDPITRIFPFRRGLFEDKVANFWCATNVAFKWKLWASRDVLVKLSALLTAVGFSPSVIGLVYSGFKLQLNAKEAASLATAPAPILSLLPYALLTSSMSFFLFSFQVHEKTILLPLMPMTLLLSGASPDSATFELGALANNVAVFSMWPLLKRDGLSIQYVALLLLWNRLIGYNPLRSRPQRLFQWLSLAVYAACAALHVLELLLMPPARFPDIYPVLNVLISTPVFALVWLWSIKRGIEVGWALGGLGSRSEKQTKLVTANASMTQDDGAPVSSDGIGRQTGMRTKSLGYAQAKRRIPQRAGSVDGS